MCLGLLLGLFGLLEPVVGPNDLIKGMTLTRSSAAYSYDSPAAETALCRLVRLAVNWVVIEPVWWMDDTGSSEIFPRHGFSPDDDEIRLIISRAHHQGLKVFLKPEVHCLSGRRQLEHNPHDHRWFNAYRRFIRHYAGLAEEAACELFAVGVELDRTADEPWEMAEWHKTINLVRQVFKGKLTYAADWRTWRLIPFWNQLDYIGINAYFPLTGHLPSFPIGSVDYLAWFWKNRHLPEIEAFLKNFRRLKPVLFTEIGYRSVAGCYLNPDDDTCPGPFDLNAQRNCCIAAYHALCGKPWFAGWFWRDWPTDTNMTPENTDYSLPGKAAQEVLRRFNTTLATHKGFCFPTTYDSTYFFPRTFPALDSLTAIGANWIAVNSRWLMADTGPDFDTIKPLFGESPVDSSIRMLIDSAHARGLAVALSCYLACSTRVWCGLHDPGPDTAWFRAESAYVAHCARLAEEKGVEMLTIGLEINRTMDSQEEARLWRHKVIPAARELYSGPLAYGASWDPVHPDFWDGIDLCGIHPYYPLVKPESYSGIYPADTARNQRPRIKEIHRLSPLSWEKLRIPALAELYHQIHKPVLFTEIGYRSIDSAAFGTTDTWQAWTAVQHKPTASNLYAVFFLSDTRTGYIAGDSGIILKTTDTGFTWTRCPEWTDRALYALDFPVPETGYAAGAAGTVLKTIDGFVHTRHQTIDEEINFYALRFPFDTRTGYLAGTKGAIFKTSDGGTSWQRRFCILSSGETLRTTLRALDFVSPRTGYIAGDSGTILMTTDAGETWHPLAVPVRLNLNGMDFISPDTGFVVGDSGLLLQTTDGGANWLISTFRTREWSFNSISVPDYDSARFIAGTRGIILRAGTAWQFNGSVQHSKTRLPLHSIQVRRQPKNGYYELLGFAVGDSGTILRTATGGRMRVDFNEQTNCYQAAFLAFWRNPEKPWPRPWFYGFHFWKWETDPTPMDIEHELVIDDFTPQGKKTQAVIRQWFERYSPERRSRTR
ncbi:MAG: glycoside hydrolase family 113 [candidate division WOR-3 bacterium]|jgi:photosystem II stability/assembly factor-like uncharacterized protein